jgi:NAD(P)-dependent dehydrogenase (short-subunit alcohol dehydrogenase family)
VPQVTTIQADAADDAAISGVCKQALNEEGKLDVFFANVGHVELLRVFRLIDIYYYFTRPVLHPKILWKARPQRLS